MIAIKRMYIAFTLLFIAILLYSAEYFTVKNTVDYYETKLTNVENLISDNDYKKARVISKEIIGNWKGKAFYLDLFLNHSHVDDIGNKIVGIEALMNNKSKYLAENNIKIIKKQLASIKESELPTFENLI